MTDLMGYLRPDGRWGFRDHFLVVPLHAALCRIGEEIGRQAGAAADVVVLRHE